MKCPRCQQDFKPEIKYQGCTGAMIVFTVYCYNCSRTSEIKAIMLDWIPPEA